jgi:hypothetical protein
MGHKSVETTMITRMSSIKADIAKPLHFNVKCNI